MPLRARNLIRKMRGGAQAHLIEAEDAAFYVVKFTNNPQHRRILVNEWLASALMRYLQIHVPDTAAIELTPEFVASSPELYLSMGTRREPVPPGIHFGSRMAVHPDRVAGFDFLPHSLIHKIDNRADFLWARAKTWTPLKGEAPARIGFFAQMIDHGFAFSGPHWQFQDSPIQGLYFKTSVDRKS